MAVIQWELDGRGTAQLCYTEASISAHGVRGPNGGVAKGDPGIPPNPIPLKLLRIKRERTRHALRIRLIEL